ncbi:MAG: energy-coupling factor ABC transporter ATP-binding protein [Thermoleophilia bacterium]
MPSSSQQRSSSVPEAVPVLELRDVVYVYPGAVTALDRVSVAFANGRRTVVMGPNGSGKTTLFSLLNGIAHPTGGEARFRGKPMKYDRAGQRELRRAVGMVFQNADSQVFSASVREDVSFGPMNLDLSVEEVRRRVDGALSALEIEDLGDRSVHTLSYGQKKRVSLAGVIAMRPEVLVLDEPFSGLDPVISADLVAILARMCESGMTLVLATHDIDFAYEWADAAVVLDRGRVLAAGEAGDVLARPDVHETLGAAPFALDVAKAAGVNGLGPLRSREALLTELAALGSRDNEER